MKSSDFDHNDDHKEYYKVLHFFMKINGLWPYQKPYEKCFWCIITMIFTESILIGEMWEVVIVWPNLTEIIDCVPNIVISLFIALEYIGILCNMKKVKKCIERIAQDWRHVSSSIEIDILKTYTLQGQKFAKAYFIPLVSLIIFAVYMSTTGFMFLLQPFLVTVTSISDNSTDILSTIPYRIEYGIDLKKYYYGILVYCYITVAAHMGILCSISLIYILFIQHTCGLFAIVGFFRYKLRNLGKKDGLETNIMIEKKDDTNYWTALDCLRRHVQAIEFGELVEGTFSNSFLFTLGLNVLVLAVGATQVLLHLDDFNEAVRYASLCLSILIQLLWLCWQAQQLLDYSIIPYNSVIEGDWYKSSIRCRKILILIMIRSLRPCEITAGKMVTLSIETFSMVVRTSASYFTVLQSMQ